MSKEFCEGIINNYKILYKTKEGNDVKICTGEIPNTKEFCIFKTAFTEDVQKKDGYYILNSSNSPKFFEILLSYMYNGRVNLTELESCDILTLLLPSDELGFQPLVTYAQETLIENHCDFIVKNVLEIIELTYQKNSLNKLWDFCLQQICDNPDHLFKSTKFLFFNPSILEIILKRDDFHVANEIIIWENLLKWACGQNPIIQQDINNWNKNEFTVMERRLIRFIPLIRFCNISSEDFLLKIYPFKKILPNDLINNIFAYHMTPNGRQNIITKLQRKSRYGSVIIKFQHFDIFASWIEKRNDSYYDIRNIPYDFKLLYRTSRDGNTAAAFHEKCDNKGPTIVIAKIANSEQIVGGYNPLDWIPVKSHNGYYKSTKDSFIFSFTDGNNLQTARVSYPNFGLHQYSIYCYASCGPIFGGGNDLVCLSNGNWTCNPLTYTIDNISRDFDVNDYEVFQINNK